MADSRQHSHALYAGRHAGTPQAVRGGRGPTAPGSESIEGPFLRVARRYSLCDDDAWEALARSFEIAMRHRARIRLETAPAWFATVVRHEAMRIRRSRSRDAHLDPAVHEPRAPEPEPERELDPRLPALRTAMRELKTDERRALIMFYAMEPGHRDGGRYRRIMRATGWSYAHVNRCLTRGRAKLRALLLDDEAAVA
ncbi:MAG: RNA polymerase sigma factor [Solirubrobacteraceae bacterium]